MNRVARKCFELAAELKEIMRPLYAKHQDDIITGHFSAPGPPWAFDPMASWQPLAAQETMMKDWDNDDVNLLKWRQETAETGFEKTPAGSMQIKEQEYFDNAILMVAMIKAAGPQALFLLAALSRLGWSLPLKRWSRLQLALQLRKLPERWA